MSIWQREYAQYIRKKSCYENKIRKQETQTLNILKVSESADDAAVFQVTHNKELQFSDEMIRKQVNQNA
jgi:hypothetical protein